MTKTELPSIADMNIYQRLAAIRKMVEVIRKDKSGFNYKYVSEAEILAKVTAGMDKYRVLLMPSIVHGTATTEPYQYVKTKNVKGGGTIDERVNEIIVTSDMTYTWVNIDNPDDHLEVPWLLVGQQGDASQAAGSALTYMNRYFLLKFFQVATPDDDPDNWRGKKAQTEAEDDAAQASAIITEVHELVTNYLNGIDKEAKEGKAASEAIAEIAKRYAKNKKGEPSANYLTITEAKTAAKLLDDISKFIGGK